MSWFTDVCSKAQTLDVPDLGDPIKDIALECGLDEAMANKVAFAGCLTLGDVGGALEHGRDVAVDEGITFDQRIEHNAFHGVGGYPAPDDIEGWKQFIQENGYDAFIQAYKDGMVDDEVLKDPGFMLVMQDEKSTYEAMLEFRSNLMASEDRIRQLISRNLAG
jgi:hypothetical protein